jgi:hypothetical protein
VVSGQWSVKSNVVKRDDRTTPGYRDHEQIPEESARGGRTWRILKVEECRLWLVGVRFVASFRPVMRDAKEAYDITRCSAIGLLPQRASLATARSEAWGTT